MPAQFHGKTLEAGLALLERRRGVSRMPVLGVLASSGEASKTHNNMTISIVYIYIYIYVYDVYIYIYIQTRERERERKRGERGGGDLSTGRLNNRGAPV